MISLTLRSGKRLALIASVLSLILAFRWFVSFPGFNAYSALQSQPENETRIEPDRNIVLAHTTIPGGAHSHGFTLFNELYLRNGTFYILTSDPSVFPEKRALIARPLEVGRKHDLEPTDQELQFLDPADANAILGNHVMRIAGLSVVLYDPDQFMHHFYHWWGEILLGFWRVYSKLSMEEDGSIVALPFPERFLMPFVSRGTWRDRAGVSGPLMRAGFPRASIEESDYWDDLLRLNVTMVFDRAMVINRETAHRHPFGGVWYKMAAGTWNVTVRDRFWEPVRESTLKNLLGYVPRLDERGSVIAPPAAISSRPIVTYISRQGAGRRLLAQDHDLLVQALMELEVEGLCDVHVVQMERLSLQEQLALVSRSTILLGVHGNGLTHQLWMPPSALSTTIEIFIPQGYVFDYEFLARNMGHRHYAIWNSSYLTYPPGTYHKGVKYPEGFQGPSVLCRRYPSNASA
ncbi:hypothetical protein C8J56DRAFT_916015 [Mycena floridula]|nr:hypothetical protein C8J56DRAFT_916015 [Mycena floridula]